MATINLASVGSINAVVTETTDKGAVVQDILGSVDANGVFGPIVSDSENAKGVPYYIVVLEGGVRFNLTTKAINFLLSEYINGEVNDQWVGQTSINPGETWVMQRCHEGENKGRPILKRIK